MSKQSTYQPGPNFALRFKDRTTRGAIKESATNLDLRDYQTCALSNKFWTGFKNALGRRGYRGYFDVC
ncbi:hypothetical protein GOFOIKOB_5193 [Methylobacterium tardum]|nr:hypothetical protein GOFOIKOB_5193 [Methylobacterium tardum]